MGGVIRCGFHFQQCQKGFSSSSKDKMLEVSNDAGQKKKKQVIQCSHQKNPLEMFQVLYIDKSCCIKIWVRVEMGGFEFL